jgi:acyl-CoA thioester hydrolase
MNVTEIRYRVPYADTDKMGVVYYANYLVFFERLRTELLREAGLPYRKLEEAGVMLPVVEAVCNYRSPARYDDLLTIRGWVESAKGVRIKIVCEVIGEKGERIASGHTVHACIGDNGKPIRPPPEILRLCP